MKSLLSRSQLSGLIKKNFNGRFYNFLHKTGSKIYGNVIKLYWHITDSTTSVIKLKPDWDYIFKKNWN